MSSFAHLPVAPFSLSPGCPFLCALFICCLARAIRDRLCPGFRIARSAPTASTATVATAYVCGVGGPCTMRRCTHPPTRSTAVAPLIISARRVLALRCFFQLSLQYILYVSISAFVYPCVCVDIARCSRLLLQSPLIRLLYHKFY